jgi:MFS family permease
MSTHSDLRGRALLFLLLLWFFWFFNFFVRLIFSPLLPLIEDEFVVTHAKASSLLAIASVGNAIALFASGIFTGFFGYKRSILLWLGISAVTVFFIPHVSHFPQLNVLLFVLWTASGIYLPSVIPIITYNFKPSSWGKALSIHDTGSPLAVFSAPLIAVLLLKFLAWRQFFYIFGVVYIIGGVVFYFSCKELKVEKRTKGSVGRILRSRSLWYLAIPWIFAAGAFMAIYNIIPLYLNKELHFDIGYSNIIFGLSRLGGVACALIVGFVVDRISLKKTLFATLFATGVFILFLSHSNTLVVQIALFFEGSVIAGFFPIGLVAISRMFKEEERSAATGTVVTTAALFGAGLFPYLFGLCGDYLSFRFGIFVFGVLVILASPLVFFIRRQID